jgi:hypothetical protein
MTLQSAGDPGALFLCARPFAPCSRLIAAAPIV